MTGEQITPTGLDTNSGSKSALTQRVVIATDQPQLTNPSLVELTDNTNTANVLKSDGTSAGQNAVLAAGTYLSVPFTTTTAQAVASTDAGNYASVMVQITSQGTSSSIAFQRSNDSVNWVTVELVDLGASTASLASSTATSGKIYVGAIGARYFRLNVTGISAGTTAGQVVFSTQPYGPLMTNVGSNSATGSSVPANAFYIGASLGGNLMGIGATNTADGIGIGTMLSVAAGQELFNGTTYDRGRNNNNTTTGDTGAKTATFAGATQTNFNQQSAYITVLCGTVSGTSPTLTAQLQWSPDAGTTWLNLGPASAAITATGNTATLLVGPENWSQAAGATPANLTTGATQTVAINAPLPRTWRLNYTIGGTSPSFAITGVYVNYVGV